MKIDIFSGEMMISAKKAVKGKDTHNSNSN